MKEIQSCRPLNKTEPQAVEKMKASNKTCQDIFRAVESDDRKSSKRTELAYAEELSLEKAHKLFHSSVHATTGATSPHVGLKLLAQASEAITPSNDSDECVQSLNIIAKTMQPLEPQDEIEGQLIAQLIVLHDQSMSWLRLAIKTDHPNFANTYLNGASKLLTRHHETLSSLLKYRRRGEQRVHVEHVHVHDGGKAIVGNVETQGGINKKNEEGPHAKV